MHQPSSRSSYARSMTVEVQTPVFEGPFDLLLHLIIRDEVDLYEVQLTDIVDAYLVEVNRLDLLDLDVATEFLLIAATLVELKSRRLLPDDPGADLDEELAIWEERDLLLARLLECKTFKDAARALEARAGVAALSHPRRAGLEDRFVDLVPDLLEGVSADDLAAAFTRAVTPRPIETVDTAHVAPIRLSVAETVVTMATQLQTLGRASFPDLTRHLEDRIEVVVHFLAILELFKMGSVEIHQARTFGEISVEWLGDAEDQLAAVDMYEG
jgi:segregation and condensation protein A